MKNKYIKYITLFIFLFIMSCGGEAGTRVGNPPTQTSFPSSLAIVSPTASSDSLATSLNSFLTDSDLMYASAYTSVKSEINDILNGTSISDCSFDPSLLLATQSNAECYSPEVAYENHPDELPLVSGILPSGDVGLWTEAESGSNEACSSAQLNSLNSVVTSKTRVALTALASMICVANVNNVDLPTVGETIDLKSEMKSMNQSNSLGVTISSSTLSRSTDTSTARDLYSYNLVFSFTQDSFEHTVTMTLRHLPLDDNNATYKGMFSYKFNIDSDDACSTSDGLDAGSISYDLDATTLTFRTDFAEYCDSDTNPFDSDGLLIASDAYSSSNTDGWKNNYSVYMATFDPDTLAGRYSYSWQAGNGDSNSRVFNLNLDSSSSLLTGDAFFGFGPAVSDSTFVGQISGFICNWAGPGNDHTLSDFVQYQQISENSSGVFTATSSNIAYSPTVSCNYDGLGTFSYDTGLDGLVDTDPGVAITNSLKSDSDADSDGYLDFISSTGFSLPITVLSL